jgi:hypothetical protein
MSTTMTTIQLFEKLIEFGTGNDRLVGSWAMEKDGTQKLLELHNYTMMVTDPNQCILPNYGKGHIGIIAEFFDVILGLNPGFVHYEWPFYADWIEEDGKYPYTYGNLIKSQWKITKAKLVESNATTRHASMYCWDRDCHYRNFVPCTHMFHFQQIDGKLCLTVTMRSQDAIKGWYLDSFLYSHLACIMAKQVGLPVGLYTVFQHNVHVYERDIPKLYDRLKYLRENSTYVSNGEIPSPLEDDYGPLYDALIYVYEEKGIYTSAPLDKIKSDYYRSLMALIYAKHYPTEDLEKYMHTPAHKRWYNNLR